MRRLLYAIACGMLLAAGGCAHNSNALPGLKTSAHVPVTFMIKVPQARANASARSSKYISPATQAIAINKQAFNVSPSSPNCTTQSVDLLCSFTVDAPAPYGSANSAIDTFTVTTYDMPLTSAGGTQGNELSSGSTTATIFAGQQNVVKITLNGVPSKVTITIPSASLTPPIGRQQTTPVTVDVRDADGYAIVGTYSTPIYLQFQGGYSYGVQFVVNGSWESYETTSSSDVVQLLYSGHNVTSTTIVAFFGNPQTQAYSATFKPVPAFGSETTIPAANVGTDLALTDLGQHVWFTEPAKADLAVWSAATSSLLEIPMPSGGVPQHLTAAGYPFDEVFTTESGSANYANVWYQNQMPYGPAGPAVYEHPLSSANVGAYQIATDSTGAGMVVTEGAVGKIGVYTSNGTVEYATGAANSSPAGIVWNSGGYYFADSGANAIGSFNPYNNTITEYPVPSSGAAPSRIAISGETWQVWFTEPGVSKVGYFNDPTKISELPCSGVPAQIITGQFETAVLTTSGDIDVYDNATGSYVVMHPPASTNGPVVGMGQRGDGDAVLLRSNGTSTALQDLFYY